MLLPFAVFKTAAPSTNAIQPMLRVGVPAGKTLHLKYLRVAWYDTNVFQTRVYINGQLNAIWDQFTYCGDIPYNVVLPENTQIRVDITANTGADSVINIALVGDMF